ncbi:Crp/Fnr family transcriptional regulator [Segnochrobactraceae bacterium EtOH-i3]
MNTARRIELLRAVPLFALLDDATLRDLAEVAAPYDVPPDARLLAAGEPADGALVVETGQVRLIGRGFAPEGTIMGPGTLIGARALVIPIRNGFDVDTITPVRLLTFTRAAFLDVLSAHPAAARPVRRHFVLMLRHMTEALGSLGLGDPPPSKG